MSVPDALSVCFSWTPFYLLLTTGRADEEREGSLHLRALEALGMASSLDPHDTGSRHRLGTLLVRLRVSPNPNLTLTLTLTLTPTLKGELRVHLRVRCAQRLGLPAVLHQAAERAHVLGGVQR